MATGWSETNFIDISKRSGIWNYYDNVGDGKAQCKLCHADIWYRGGLTSSLWKQMDSKHRHAMSSKLWSYTASASSSCSSLTVSGVFSRTSITTARTEKLSDLIARTIAIDTLPISFIQGAGFRQLMAFLEPGYWLPCTMCKDHEDTLAVPVRQSER